MNAPSPCAQPGCPVLVTGGGRCTEHRYRRPNGRDGTDTAWRKARARAIWRDGGRCTRCRSKGPLEVHHRDGDWRNNQSENLVVLCPPCHLVVGAAGDTRGETPSADPHSIAPSGSARAVEFQPRGARARSSS